VPFNDGRAARLGAILGCCFLLVLPRPWTDGTPDCRWSARTRLSGSIYHRIRLQLQILSSSLHANHSEDLRRGRSSLPWVHVHAARGVQLASLSSSISGARNLGSVICSFRFPDFHFDRTRRDGWISEASLSERDRFHVHHMVV